MKETILRLGGALLLLAVIGLAGCGSPSPLKVPVQGDVSLQDNVVTWTTDVPTLCAVRYGTRSGAYDRVAYPPAASREDKALLTEHRVPLLGVSVGETVYLQALNRTEDGRILASEEMEFTIASRPTPRPILEWTMIDVGFGDSHLLTMPTSGERILIDGGETRDWPNVDKYLQSAGVNALDVVVGTHIHSDHIGGLVGQTYTDDDGVLGAYPVGVYLDTTDKSMDPRSYNQRMYEDILDTIAAHDIGLDTVRVGDTNATNPALAWDSSVSVRVLNAGHGESMGGSGSGDYLNNDSVVLRLSYGDVDFLLGGDAEAPVQAKMAADYGSALESEVLKVHHHGHDDSSQEDYLNAVNARVGLIPITVYEESGGILPGSETLLRLRERDTDVYASDRAEPLGLATLEDDGFNITVFTDGRSYELLVVPSQSVHASGDQ